MHTFFSANLYVAAHPMVLAIPEGHRWAVTITTSGLSKPPNARSLETSEWFRSGSQQSIRLNVGRLYPPWRGHAFDRTGRTVSCYVIAAGISGGMGYIAASEEPAGCAMGAHLLEYLDHRLGCP